MVFLSGQVAWDAQQQLVGGDDLKSQALQAFRNVETGLRAAGATLRDIVAMRLYIMSSSAEKSPAIKEALLETFAGMAPPTTSWIGVSALADEGFLIEVEVTAVVAEDAMAE